MVSFGFLGFAALSLLVLSTAALPTPPASSTIVHNTDFNKYHQSLIESVDARRKVLLSRYWGAESEKADFTRQVNNVAAKDVKRIQAAADLEEDIARDMLDAEEASAGYLGHTTTAFRRRLSRRAIDYSAKILESSPCASQKELKFRYYDDFLSEIRTSYKEDGDAFQASEWAYLNWRDDKMYMHHWDVIHGEKMKLENELTKATTAWDYKVLLENIEHQTQEGSQSSKQKYERYVPSARVKRAEAADAAPQDPEHSFPSLAARNDSPPTETDRDRKYDDAMRSYGLVESDGLWELPKGMGDQLVTDALAALPGNATLQDLNPQLLAEIEDRHQRALAEFVGDESLRADYVDYADMDADNERLSVADAEDREDYADAFEYFRIHEARLHVGSPQEKAVWRAEDAAADKALDEKMNESKPPGLAARDDSPPVETTRDRKYDEAMLAQGLVDSGNGNYLLPDEMAEKLINADLAALPNKNATLKDLNPMLLAAIEHRRQKELAEFAGDESLRATYAEDVEDESQKQRQTVAEAEDRDDYAWIYEWWRYEDAWDNRGTPQEKAQWDVEDAAAAKAYLDKLNEGKPPAGLGARRVF